MNPNETGLGALGQQIERLAKATGRPAILKLDDGSGRTFIYSDADAVYVEDKEERFVPQRGTVSSVESLVAIAREQVFLGFGMEHGEGMRVTFTPGGATLDVNVADGRHQFLYRRVHSSLWYELNAAVGVGDFTHKEFLRQLQRLGPAIQAGTKVQAAFRRVTITRNSKRTSEPLLVNGERGEGYEFAIAIDGTEERVPAGIVLRVPFGRGTSKTYEVAVEIEVDTDDDDELVFRMIAPGLQNVTDEAIADEMAYFRDVVLMDDVELTKLVMVQNFS